jgi:hypothetical protein
MSAFYEKKTTDEKFTSYEEQPNQSGFVELLIIEVLELQCFSFSAL